MPPETVGGPGIGLNLAANGGAGVDPAAGGSAFGGDAAMACNGHAPRYGGLVTPGAPSDGAGRCPAAVGPSLLDEEDDTQADGQPPIKRLHFADSNGWSP